MKRVTGKNSPIHFDVFSKKQEWLMQFAKRRIKTAMDDGDVAVALEVYERLLIFHSGGSLYKDPEIYNEILNHLACCYRRLNRLDDGLGYLKKSLNVCKGHNLNSGLTYTNMTAVYSQKGLSQKALKMSQLAVKELYPLVLNNSSQENTRLLAIAYYNCGNQEFKIKDYNSSMISFERGLKVIKKSFSPSIKALRDKLKKGLIRSRAKYNSDKNSKISVRRRRSCNSSKMKRSQFNSSQRVNTASDISTLSKISTGKFKMKKKRRRPNSSNKSALKKSQVVDIPGLNDPTKFTQGGHKVYELGDFRTKNMYIVDEYSAIEDIKRTDKIQFYSSLAPERGNPYASKKPRYRGSSGLIKTKIRRPKGSGLFDGSAKRKKGWKKNNFITNNSRIEAKPPSLKKRGDHYYDSVDYNPIRAEFENVTNDVDEVEKELLDDSWRESCDSSSFEQKSGSEEYTMIQNRNNFIRGLQNITGNGTEEDRVISATPFRSPESDNRFQQKNFRYEADPSADLDDWTPEPSQEIRVTNNGGVFNQTVRPGSAIGDRQQTASGRGSYRRLEDPSLKKIPERIEEIEETRTLVVSQVTRNDTSGVNQSLYMENQKLKEENLSLMSALEEEKERNRIAELRERRKREQVEMGRSVVKIQRGWRFYSTKRSEKRLIRDIERNGFKLIKKIWSLIPYEKGGSSPSKLLVFENNRDYHITARDVKTQITRGISITKDDSEFSINSVQEKLSIGSDDNLKYCDIVIEEMPHEENTEDPIISNEDEDNQDDDEKPLFPPENSLSENKNQMADFVMNEVIGGKDGMGGEGEEEIEDLDFDEVEDLIIEDELAEDEDLITDSDNKEEKGLFEQDEQGADLSGLGVEEKEEGKKMQFFKKKPVSKDSGENKPLTEDQIQVRNASATFLQDFLKYNGKIRESKEKKKDPFKTILTLDDNKKYFLYIYDHSKTSKKKVECFGIMHKFVFDTLIISDYLVTKMKKSNEYKNEKEFNKAIVQKLKFDVENKKISIQEDKDEYALEDINDDDDQFGLLDADGDDFGLINDEILDEVDAEGDLLDMSPHEIDPELLTQDHEFVKPPLETSESKPKDGSKEEDKFNLFGENEQEEPLLSIEDQQSKATSKQDSSSSSSDNSHKKLDELDKSEIGVSDPNLLQKQTLNIFEDGEADSAKDNSRGEIREEEPDDFDYDLDAFYDMNYRTKSGKSMTIVFRDNVDLGFIQVEAYPRGGLRIIENLLDKHKIQREKYARGELSKDEWQKNIVNAFVRSIKSDEDDKLSLEDLDSHRGDRDFFEMIEN